MVNFEDGPQIREIKGTEK
jgi:hypothetical protein